MRRQERSEIGSDELGVENQFFCSDQNEQSDFGSIFGSIWPKNIKFKDQGYRVVKSMLHLQHADAQLQTVAAVRGSCSVAIASLAIAHLPSCRHCHCHCHSHFLCR